MDEGFLQLLFILLIIVASVFDAVARSRKKKQQKERMDREEGIDPEDGDGEWATVEAPPRRERTKAPMGVPTEPEASDEPVRETADAMVPEDFWAILTGQQPEPEPEQERHAPDVPPLEPRTPAPVPSDRIAPRMRAPAPPPDTATPDAAIETRRSDLWMEGVGGRKTSERWTTGIEEEEARVYAPIPEPWDAIEDVAADEIGDGSGGAAPAVSEPIGTRRRGAGGAYTRLLETGRVDDLRKGIVLREILGPPAAFRDPLEEREGR